MFDLATTDLFATKGVEYVLVIGFLGALALFWRLLRGPVGVGATAPPRGAASGWFAQPDDRYYHRGHVWARTADSDVVTVGLDDFAQRLLGRPDAVRLPRLGARLTQGGPACSVQIDGESVKLLSPVAGRVVQRNETLLSSPGPVNSDPYDEGWLFKVRVPKLRANLNNLMRGALASAWQRQTEQRLLALHAGELGSVMQDGGLPVSGIARALSPDDWAKIARDFLLSA